MRRGEIWWATLDKRRPVLILTRDAALAVRTRVMVAPLTRTERGLPFEVAVTKDDGVPRRSVISLDNVTTISKAHLQGRMATLGPERMTEVCAALSYAIDC